MQLSQKMKHCVGYKINIRKKYLRRNPDAENPPSHSQNTRYLRSSLKLTPNFFGEPVRYLFKCRAISSMTLGLNRGGGGAASYNGQSKGGSAREGYIFRL